MMSLSKRFLPMLLLPLAVGCLASAQQPEQTGFAASNMLHVKLDEIARVSELIDGPRFASQLTPAAASPTGSEDRYSCRSFAAKRRLQLANRIRQDAAPAPQ
jgi:hypothetical protein